MHTAGGGIGGDEMSGKPDGGPANPTFPGQYDDNGTWNEGAPGKSLRDWFAGQALTGLVSAMQDEKARKLTRINASASGIGGKEQIAAAAYEYADAMLAERAK